MNQSSFFTFRLTDSWAADNQLGVTGRVNLYLEQD